MWFARARTQQPERSERAVARVGLRRVANQRVHGTTHEQVAVRWDVEQFSLQSLAGQPPYPYVDGELRKVARDAYVDWQGSRYSVPWQYAGQEVWVQEIAGKWISARAASGLPCTARRNGNTAC